MVKSANSRHSSHLQSDSEKKELADNVGALMAVKKIDEYMNRHRLGVMNLFRDFDKSRDGLLQREEIMAGLMKLDVEMTMGQAKALVAFLDQGHDGEVDLAEVRAGEEQEKMQKSEPNIRTYARFARTHSWTTASRPLERRGRQAI